MSFNWSEYFQLARELAGEQIPTPSSEEARLRSAISRAYYAGYCKARNYLRDVEKDSRIPKGRHQQDYIIEQFKKGSKERRKVGANLDRLRDERRRADYEDRFTKLPDMTRLALMQAERSIGNLRRL